MPTASRTSIPPSPISAATSAPQEREAFLADGKTQRAVIEGLIVIGEAAARIVQAAPELETTHAETWQRLREATGMRNLLTHEYFRVDASVVWDTVYNDLADLEASLRKLAVGSC